MVIVMYTINFEPAALILSFVCLIYVLATKRRQYKIPKGLKNKLQSQHFIFLMLLVSNILSTTSSIIGVYLSNIVIDAGPQKSLIFWQYLFHLLYFVFHSTLSCLFCLYILNVTGSSVSRKKIFFVIFILPYLLSELLILTNYWTDFAFYMDESNIYHRGKLMPLLYSFGVIYIILGFVFFFKYKKAVSRVDSIAIGTVIIVATFGIALQAIRSDILFELFAEAIAFLILMILLEEKRGHINQITGLLNRTAFIDANRTLIETNQEYELVLVKFANMESFKEMIDEKEHNHIMIEIANWFTQSFPDIDIYGYHDNKFSCVIKNKELTQNVIDKTIERFNEDWHLNNYNYRIDSIVTRIKIPSDINSLSVLEDVISSNYQMRKAGSYFVPFDQVNELSNVRLRERQLRSAISENKLMVKYQPIWSNKEQKTIACEALLRINTPELIDVSPEVYIPVAEKTGLIRDIGLFVFEEVCKFLNNERLKKSSIKYIEINLSLFQFLYDDLVESFESIRKKYNVEASQINLEITESASTSDIKRFSETIEKFKSLGYSFSLDDFGTGYSNLVGLLQSEYKNVKIDKSIISLAVNNEKTAHLLSNLIGLIRTSISDVIQEGVETKEQLDLILNCGCDLIQGFYFSAPLTEDDFLDYLEK